MKRNFVPILLTLNQNIMSADSDMNLRYFSALFQAELKKKRTFRKYTYRGVDLDQLLDMNNEQLMELFPCRIRRKFSRGLKRKPMALIKKLRKKKKEAPPNEKPDVVKTHLRDMIIVPEMTGSVVGVYNGKTFNQVEIKVRVLPTRLGSFCFVLAQRSAG